MIAKPEKGEQIEMMIINMVQTGRIQGKVTEAQLVNMLEQINSATNKSTTVKVCIFPD